VLSIGWGLLVDFSLIAIRYFKTLKYYTIAHGLLFFIINITSIPMIILMIVKNYNIVIYNFTDLPLNI
jgi:hypothetical protein